MKYISVVTALVLVHAVVSLPSPTVKALIDRVADSDTVIDGVRDCMECRRVLETRDCFHAVSFNNVDKVCYAVSLSKNISLSNAAGWTTFVASGSSATFVGTTLLSADQQLQVSEWYGSDAVWNLIYKATTHGFGCADFHNRSDNKGENIGVIRSSNGYLFGWYTSQSWTTRNTSVADDKAFIFTLTNPAGLAAKYKISQTQYAIYDHYLYGPSLGGGLDIYVCDQANSNSYSHTNFPYSYTDTTGRGTATFTGDYNFMVADIEVFERLK